MRKEISTAPARNIADDEMINLYNKFAQLFYKLAYQGIRLLFYFTRPTLNGVYVAVWYEEKLLIIKNSYKNSFTIPCGRIKRGEEIALAAVRELREEVGIRLEPDQLTFVGTYAGHFRYASDNGNFF